MLQNITNWNIGKKCNWELQTLKLQILQIQKTNTTLKNVVVYFTEVNFYFEIIKFTD